MGAALLSVRGICKTFGALEVLKGVDLEAGSGDVVAILGSSGSGKSTFLRCINLLETPTEGAIRLAGEKIALKRGRDGNLHPVDRKQLTRLRTRVGMDLYKKHHLIENFFAKLNEFKRIALRVDKSDTSFRAIIYATAAIINSQ